MLEEWQRWVKYGTKNVTLHVRHLASGRAVPGSRSNARRGRYRTALDIFSCTEVGHYLDDFLESFPTVSRERAEAYLEMTLEAAGKGARFADSPAAGATVDVHVEPIENGTESVLGKRPTCGVLPPGVPYHLTERYGVERLDLFGSASFASDSSADGGFDPDRSDLDFVVAFERRDPPDLFRRYFGLEEDLEALFGREADLVMEGALQKSRRFAGGVERSRVPLYGP